MESINTFQILVEAVYVYKFTSPIAILKKMSSATMVNREITLP